MLRLHSHPNQLSVCSAGCIAESAPEAHRLGNAGLRAYCLRQSVVLAPDKRRDNPKSRFAQKGLQIPGR